MERQTKRFCDEKEVGRRVRRGRAYAGLTQAELAEAAGVSTPTLRRLEAGDGCKIGTLSAVLERLQLDPRDILWSDGVEPYTRSTLVETCDTSALATDAALLDRIHVLDGKLKWRRADGRLVVLDDDASAYANDKDILDRLQVTRGAVYWQVQL